MIIKRLFFITLLALYPPIALAVMGLSDCNQNSQDKAYQNAEKAKK
jgi:hypothetical protein